MPLRMMCMCAHSQLVHSQPAKQKLLFKICFLFALPVLVCLLKKKKKKKSPQTWQPLVNLQVYNKAIKPTVFREEELG